MLFIRITKKTSKAYVSDVLWSIGDQWIPITKVQWRKSVSISWFTWPVIYNEIYIHDDVGRSVYIRKVPNVIFRSPKTVPYSPEYRSRPLNTSRSIVDQIFLISVTERHLYNRPILHSSSDQPSTNIMTPKLYFSDFIWTLVCLT